MLVGLFLFRGELSLLLYAAFYATMIHLWIVRYEEPGLRRRFGRAYVAYLERVPRWFALPGQAAPVKGPLRGRADVLTSSHEFSTT